MSKRCLNEVVVKAMVFCGWILPCNVNEPKACAGGYICDDDGVVRVVDGWML